MSEADQKAFRMYGKVPQKSVLSKINKVRYTPARSIIAGPEWEALASEGCAPPRSWSALPLTAPSVFKLLTRRRNASTSILATT
jgi:hypothetical protein